jgi:hypothetical protein
MRLLTEPEDEIEKKVWDLFANVFKLFIEHFEVSSGREGAQIADVEEGGEGNVQDVEKHLEWSGWRKLDGSAEWPRASYGIYVKALPAELRQRVEHVLWAQSPPPEFIA